MSAADDIAVYDGAADDGGARQWAPQKFFPCTTGRRTMAALTALTINRRGVFSTSR